MDLTFEQALEELNKIIAQFQTGTLKLQEAVSKYAQCKKLIDICSNKLAELEQVLATKCDDTAIDVTKVDFEQNIEQLKIFKAQLQDATLEHLCSINKDYSRLYRECESVLENFKTAIEYR